MSGKPTDTESEFAALMSGVKRLHDDRVNHYQQRTPKSIAKKIIEESARTDFAALTFSQQTEIRESYFDHGIQKKLRKKIRQGLLPVDDRLDLHGCTQKTAQAALSAFLEHSSNLGHKMVIVIHGKGQRSQNSAVLKPLTLHWLSQQESVLAWCPAQPGDGGHGASYVYLRQ